MERRNEGGEEEKGGWNMASEVPRDRNCPLDNHKLADNKDKLSYNVFCEAINLLSIALMGNSNREGKGQEEEQEGGFTTSLPVLVDNHTILNIVSNSSWRVFLKHCLRNLNLV